MVGTSNQSVPVSWPFPPDVENEASPVGTQNCYLIMVLTSFFGEVPSGND